MNKQLNFLQLIFSFFDLAALNGVFVSWLFYQGSELAFGTVYLFLFFSYNVAWLLGCSVFSVYSRQSFVVSESFLRRSAKAYFLFLQLVIVFAFFYSESLSRGFLAKTLLSFALLLLLSRVIYVWISRHIDLEERHLNRAVILGYNELGKKIASTITSENKNVTLLGYFEDYNQVTELSMYPILGNLKECLDFSIRNGISEIYSTLLPRDNEYLYELAETAEDNFIRVRFVLDYNLFINRNMHVDFLDDMPVLSLRREPLTEIGNRIKKRSFDILFSAGVIIFLLSWLLPLIALIIKLDSKGPVFFKQNRLGRNKKVIRVLKFRSMKITESDTEFRQATKDDDRITGVGRFLRKTSLDELPQFFNVLFGDMSICGPRPHPLKMNEDYKNIINKYMIRHFLKPGITGWAQVNGYRGETRELAEIQGRVEHDIWYMENWTFWLDVKIIFLTVYNIIKGEEKAY